MKKGIFIFTWLWALQAIAAPAKLATLSKAGFIIGPDSKDYPIDRSWLETVEVMRNLDIYDQTVAQMADVLCSQDRNRSVLLVGESSNAYRYIFARLANFNTNAACKGMAHVEINTSAIESGNKYVGEVEEYWQSNVLNPAENKDAILYFSNLSALIGLGSHSNDATGIEQEFAANISTGRLRAVSYMNKWEYQKYRQSEHSYVVNSFAETYRIEPINEDQVRQMVGAYMGLFPNLTLTEDNLKYLTNTLEYYQPNILEPERTINVLKAVLRRAMKNAQGSANYTITFQEMKETIFDFVQVPDWLVEKDFQIIKDLEENLKEEMVGNEDGQRAAVREAKIGYVTGRTNKKPIATLLLAGPTGTGKSHLAKSLADVIEMPIVTIDMTAYQSQESFDHFVDIMARHLTVQPYAIYLFEEIDKASPEVLDRLFFMMDDGLFYDRQQRPLFARGAYIIMTTNAGSEVVLKHKDDPELKELMTLRLQEIFRLSFLNRFDSVAISTPFTKKEYEKMTKINYKKKQKRFLNRFGWHLTADKDTLKFIAKYGRSAVYGSRPNERLMENIFSVGISEYQLEHGPLSAGAKIEITKGKDKLDFMCTIDEDKSVTYEADLDINAGE